MLYVLSFLLALGGIGCFVWHKKLSLTLARTSSRALRAQFGNGRDWDSPGYLIVYKAMVLVTGIILLIYAFGLFNDAAFPSDVTSSSKSATTTPQTQ
jgi:hypothetical protein